MAALRAHPGAAAVAEPWCSVRRREHLAAVRSAHSDGELTPRSRHSAVGFALASIRAAPRPEHIALCGLSRLREITRQLQFVLGNRHVFVRNVEPELRASQLRVIAANIAEYSDQDIPPVLFRGFHVCPCRFRLATDAPEDIDFPGSVKPAQIVICLEWKYLGMNACRIFWGWRQADPDLPDAFARNTRANLWIKSGLGNSTGGASFFEPGRAGFHVVIRLCRATDERLELSIIKRFPPMIG